MRDIILETTPITQYIKDPVSDNFIKLSNHIRRYHDAIKALNIDKIDTVIDASCGDGYGSFIIAHRARRVYGLDVNESYINNAQSIFKKGNLKFYTYDLYKHFYTHKATKLLCLETFEHIAKNKINTFIDMLLDFIDYDGKIFLTTQLGNNCPNENNKYHLNEPSVDALYELFKPYFDKIEFNITTYMDIYCREFNECQMVLSEKINETKNIIDR